MAAILDAARDALSLASRRPVPTKRLRAHKRFVSSVAFSHDSTRLVSASEDGTVQLWEVPSARRVGKIMNHGAPVTSVAISVDGRIASAGDGGRILFWDSVTTEQLLESREQHTDKIWSVAFSPDGTTLASGSADRTLMVWNAQTGERVAGPIQTNSTIRCLAFSPNGAAVASAEEDEQGGIIRSRDTGTWEEKSTPIRLASTVSIAWSPDGRSIVSGSLDRTISFFNVSTGTEIQRCIGPPKQLVYGVAFFPNGGFAASASWDGVVRLWSTSSPNTVGSSLEHDGPVLCIAISPDGRYIASGTSPSGGEVGSVVLWDASSFNVAALQDVPVDSATPLPQPENQETPDINASEGKDRSADTNEPKPPNQQDDRASDAEASKVDQKEQKNQAQDNRSETSSVRNFLDMPATAAPGADAGPSNIYDGFFEHDNPDLLAASRDKGKQKDESPPDNVPEKAMARASRRIFKRVQRLQEAFARTRESSSPADIEMDDLGASQRHDTTRSQPPLIQIAAGRYKNPVVIHDNGRRKKYRRRKDKMPYEEWERLEEEKRQQQQQAGPSTSGSRGGSAGSGTSDTSSSSDSWESYHTGSSKFWNWLCFKCTCLCC